MSDDTAPSFFTRLSTSAAAGLVLWIPRTLLGLLAVYPLLSAIQVSGIASGPEGDAVLFRPGSLLLLELLRVGLPELSAGLKSALPLAALAAIIELVPLAGALDLLWVPGSTLAERLARALRLFPRFLGLGVISLLAQAALLLAASLLGAALKTPLHRAGEQLQTLAPLIIFGLGLIACGGFGSVVDVARAALVQEELTAREALSDALACLRRQPFGVLVGAYPSVAGGALACLSALWFLTRVDLSGPSHLAIALSFAVHQAAVLFAIGFRVRWLKTALELRSALRR